MSNKEYEEHFKNCLKYWFCEDKSTDFNNVLDAAQVEIKKGNHIGAAEIYKKAQSRVIDEFKAENENPEREYALLKLIQTYNSLAEDMLDKGIKLALENRARLIRKMDEKCPKTEEDLEELAKIEDPQTREAMSELITVRNYCSKCETAKKNICINFNEDYEECKKKNKR